MSSLDFWPPRLSFLLALIVITTPTHAAIHSGSDGRDGALNPTSDVVINMANRPDGIYHYTSINIPSGVTVRFIPNARNTPVVWLVQMHVNISGTIDVSAEDAAGTKSAAGGMGGPGGYRGGNAGATPGRGQGPGGGMGGDIGECAAFGAMPTKEFAPLPGVIYGSPYLLPLLGGSGGGASSRAERDMYGGHGGGGGGAILIAAPSIRLDGAILANGDAGGLNFNNSLHGGGGSGGSVRLITAILSGHGNISCLGGFGANQSYGGLGRARLDVLDCTFGGQVRAIVTQGFQPIVIPGPEDGVGLSIIRIGGVSVSSTPTGTLSTPDAILSSQQASPVTIVVRCSGIPLGTPITVTVVPLTGQNETSVGQNTEGSIEESRATILLSIPRGGGLIYATAATLN